MVIFVYYEYRFVARSFSVRQLSKWTRFFIVNIYITLVY